MAKFSTAKTVGVAISPEKGLEVAQIDYDRKIIVNYGCVPLEYNINQRVPADIDELKISLKNLFTELHIPKGSGIQLSLSNILTKTQEFPASMEFAEISGNIEDSLLENPLFADEEFCYSVVNEPSPSMQISRVIYTVHYKNFVIELVSFIKDCGYHILNVDTSVNSTLNALMYLDKVQCGDDTNWVLAVIDDISCTVYSMNGNVCMEIFEERLRIGEVLDDDENYDTVLKTFTPILKNLPSQYLCVVSKTNVISAQILSNKIRYASPITYFDANRYSESPIIEVSGNVANAEFISLDIVGAVINRNFDDISSIHFDLFNYTLGDIYMNDQPPTIVLGSRLIVLSKKFLIRICTVIFIILSAIIAGFLIYLLPKINTAKAEISEKTQKINEIDKFLEENKNISREMFDEGIEIRGGLTHNKSIFMYYNLLGSEIPPKLWLTEVSLADKIIISGQANNLESIYKFFKVLKDYNPDSNLKLKKLRLAAESQNSQGSNEIDAVSLLTSLSADFYEFTITNGTE